MKLHIEIEAASIQEAVDNFLRGASDSALVTELCRRLEAEGKMLQIHDVEPAPAPKDPEPKVTKPRATKPKPAPAPEPAPQPEPTEPVVEGADIAPSDTGGAEVSLLDVRNALDVAAKRTGLVTARTKMVEVGGAERLVDIDPSKYAALVKALAA